MKPQPYVARMQRSVIRGRITATSPALRFAACGLRVLNAEAVTLAETIKRNFEELGV
jgi:hypothetical protein